MAYGSGDMKWLEGFDRSMGGSISLKLAQVPVYLQDRWRWWRATATLTCFDHFDLI